MFSHCDNTELPPEEALSALARSMRNRVRGQPLESIFPQPPGVSDLLLCFKKNGPGLERIRKNITRLNTGPGR